MCALCGVLGVSDHWTDAVARPGVFAVEDSTVARRRERARRIAAANRVLGYYRMTLSDWHGGAYVLATATGKTEMVDNLAHLWQAAERLRGAPCDPFDPSVLRALESGDA